MSATVSHLTEIAAKQHKIVMMRVLELERINRYQANMQLKRMKIALWIDSKGLLAFIVSDGWLITSAHDEQLKHLQNHPIETLQ